MDKFLEALGVLVTGLFFFFIGAVMAIGIPVLVVLAMLKYVFG